MRATNPAVLLALCVAACSGHSGGGVPQAVPLPLVPLPWVGPADAAIEGTVRDANGAPVAGAQVCAWDLASQRLSHEDPAPTCAVAGPGGEFVLGGLLPASYSVHAGAPTFQPAEFGRLVPLRAGERHAAVDLVLAPGGAPLHGEVVDAGGAPVVGAWIADAFPRDEYGLYPPGPVAGAHSDAAGRFTLWVRPGRHELMVEAGNFLSKQVGVDTGGASPRVVLVRAGDEPRAPASAIRGAVIDAGTGQPVAGARVLAFTGPQNHRSAAAVAYTDAGGAFRLAVGSGHFTVIAETGNRQGEADREVRLDLGEERVLRPFALFPLPGVHARVVVTGGGESSSGVGCSRGLVALSADPGGAYREAIGPDGEVFFPALAPGSYQVQVWCAGAPRAVEFPAVTVERTPITGLQWEVWTGRRIRGTVVDHQGHPVAGLGVVAEAGSERVIAGMDDRTDSLGRFEIAGLAPGSYVVRAGERPGETVEVPADRDLDGVRLTAVAEPAGELRGVVVDEGGAPVRGASVVVHDFPGPIAVTAEDGTFSVPHLRPDVYRVTAQRPCSPQDGEPVLSVERVRVGEQGVADVRLVVSGAPVLRGRVVRGGAPVAGALVAAGVDPWLFSSPDELLWGAPTTTDHEGRFAFHGLSERCDYTLRASVIGGGEGLVARTSIGEEVTVVIEETATLAGRIVGTAPEAFTIWLLDRKAHEGVVDSSRGRVFRRTGGRWGFEGLAPGEYEVHLASQAGRAKATFTLAAGETLEDVPLEYITPGGVRVRVVDGATRKPVAGVSVYAEPKEPQPGVPDGGSGDGAFTDEDGRFELPGLLPGPVVVGVPDAPMHTVHVESGRFTEVTVVVPARGE